MNSGGSNDLNRIKIDSQPVEKFSFNVDIVAAMAWQDPQQCTNSFMQVHSYISYNGRSSCFCTVHYIIVDQ